MGHDIKQSSGLFCSFLERGAKEKTTQGENLLPANLLTSALKGLEHAVGETIIKEKASPNFFLPPSQLQANDDDDKPPDARCRRLL